MINKTYPKKNKINKKKKRADLTSAHKINKQKVNSNQNKRDVPIDLDNEIIIGLQNIDRKEYLERNKKLVKKKNKKLVTKKRSVKKIKKLSEKQIKRRKFILKVIKWTSLLVIMIGIIICIMLSPLFNIKNIEVKDNNKISSEQIISLSSIKVNDNTFKYSKKDIKNKIKENAYIGEVKVSRILPDGFKIQVKERIPKLMLLFGNAYVYIDNQGYILEVSDENINLPIIKGYKTEEKDIVPGKRLCNSDLEQLTVVLKIVELAQSEGLFDKITAVDIEDKNDYKIIMEEEQKNAHLGDCSMLEERILWVKTILDETKELQGDIFVNMNLNSEKPFFRERV